MSISLRGHSVVWLLCLGLAGACGNSEPAAKAVSLSGAVQKGPFVLGSTVNVSPLDGSLNPTGQVFNTQTTDDLGQFSVSFAAAGLVALEGSGFYYNEVTGRLSNAPLTLRALYDVQMEGAQSAYINLVTHLSFQRIKKLVVEGAALAAATAQAESELRTALGIGSAEFTPSAAGVNQNILGSDNDANAYLFAVSSVIAQAALDKSASGNGGPIDATLQELLNTTALDLSDDGRLQPAAQKAYLDAQRHLDPDATVSALRERLALIGASASLPDFNRVLDTDGDGVVNAADNCPFVANPEQAPISDGLCKLTVQSFKDPSGPAQRLLPVDLLGDGTYSLLSIYQSPMSVSYSLWKNNGAGALAAPAALTLTPPSGASGMSSCCSFLSLDVNGDSKADLLRVNSDWMAVYAGDGQGGFGAAQPLSDLGNPVMVDGRPFLGMDTFAAADFKKDGLVDVVGRFAGNTGFHIVLLTQQAGGQWSAPAIVADLSFNVMAAADMDRDGKSDILYLDSLLSGAHLYFGKGDGMGGFTLNNVATCPPGQIVSLAVGDYNADSFPDVLIGSLDPTVMGKVNLLLSTGDGAGNFTAPAQTAISANFLFTPLTGNFASAGQTSVLIRPVDQNRQPTRTLQLWTLRNGQFSAGPVRPFIHFNPLLARDMDKDGKLDLVGTAINDAGNSRLDVALQR